MAYWEGIDLFFLDTEVDQWFYNMSTPILKLHMYLMTKDLEKEVLTHATYSHETLNSLMFNMMQHFLSDQCFTQYILWDRFEEKQCKVRQTQEKY